MKVITCPEKYIPQRGEISCFLAGGISNCPDWQKKVIEILQEVNPEYLIVYNPRRENFPIDDPNAAREQIEWEFKYLEQADIFSMYFCAGESDQPICMYELGRNLLDMKGLYPDDYMYHIVVSVEDGYRRAQDVEIQTELALNDHNVISMNADYITHAKNILLNYVFYKYKNTSQLREKYNEIRKKWPY